MKNISDLETALSIHLPEQYRNFLLHYPPDLRSTKYSNDPKWGGPAEFELLTDLQKIAELNGSEREFWPESDYADVEFPASYLLVGHDGCGNLYAIDASVAGDSPAFEFDHELGEWSQTADSIDQFARQLMDMAEELRRDEK